ncbi:hypothetical protein AB0O75_47155 [Streptomyces sp. NPDC088921]|uniref:hypothetical protein n=1 Tax=unclassified Streptomyces TaxID=2593676 RepID=UPI00343A0266
MINQATADEPHGTRTMRSPACSAVACLTGLALRGEDCVDAGQVARQLSLVL